MKYIRTKDKIEKVPNDYANKLVECPNLKIADTIEELCDEFAIKTKMYNKVFHTIEDLYNYLVDETEYSERQNMIIYGAIWTDKGLIYVAKMNDKGELELL